MENSNRELFSTNSEFLKKLYSNILFIAAVEYLIYNEGLNPSYMSRRTIHIQRRQFSQKTQIIGDRTFNWVCLYQHSESGTVDIRNDRFLL